MAHGFLESFDSKLEVFSAGTIPAGKINPKAVKVMLEAGIDISMNTPKSVNLYLDQEWDYVITVCDDANESCPFFAGIVKHRLHMGFEDPSNVSGTEEFVLNEFRRIRNEIQSAFYKFYTDYLK